MKRHLLIPDTQIRKGVPLQHIDWAAAAVLRYQPTDLIVLGDWWDMPSLSSYDKPGSRAKEGLRYQDDIDAGNEAWERFEHPLRKSKKLWRRMRKKVIFGNHDWQRIVRAIDADPKLEGKLSTDDLLTPGFERFPFLEPVEVDGVWYSHYFQSSHSDRAIGGEIVSRLNRIGSSFVQGHEQGFRYGNKILPTGRTLHGVVAGSFYLHDEKYRGPQGRTAGHWTGLVVLNDVVDGDFDVMPLSMRYLRRTFGKKRK